MSLFHHSLSIVLIVSVILLSVQNVSSQRTFLDEDRTLFNSLRNVVLKFIGKTSTDPRNFELMRKLGKLQKQFDPSTPFFCDVKGPGRRSSTPPISVHRLRPGDIDIVGAMGDSLTAGSGAMSTNILQVITENKGLTWSIGGQDTWLKFLTIPNILKEFNPKLYGYSLADGISKDKSARFNVADLGAMSRDMPHQARILVQRLRGDRKVNMKQHWKLVTLLIGANDFCGDMCYYSNPKMIVSRHEKDLSTALRYLRDNVPRLMVNVVSAFSTKLLLTFKGLSPECFAGLHFECPCMFGTRVEKSRKMFFKIMEDWQEKEYEVVNREEFHTKDDFTVNLQTFTKHLIFPKTKNNLTDFRYMAQDCFHLSQKGYARAATALWNNMLELEGQKSTSWKKEFFDLKCPTDKRPYLITRENT